MKPSLMSARDFIRIVNGAASSTEAMFLTNYRRSSFFSRCRFLRSQGIYIKRFHPPRNYGYRMPPLPERKYDSGTPLIGGVRLNNEIWTIDEITEIHQWLYGCELPGHHWLGFRKHFRWLLAHNKKSYWFRIRDEEILGRNGYDRLMSGQGK